MIRTAVLAFAPVLAAPVLAAPVLAASVIAVIVASPSAAGAAEYVSIVQSVDVARPPADVMRRTGGFCDIGAWFKTSCVITSGRADEVGAVRRIADRIDEVLVARTASSYTYAQPLAPNSYHGTVEYQPLEGGRATRVVYSLFYDLSTLPTPRPGRRTGSGAPSSSRACSTP